jgi:hypothetical protein
MHWIRYLVAALPLIAWAQPSPLPDEACRPEFDRIAPQCDGSAALKECRRQRLSPACTREAERCIAQKMSHGCKHTAARFVEARKACDEAVQRVWQLCNPEPADKRARCFEQHRGAANSACQ